MKIYRVVYENGKTRSLWLTYRSASGSAAQARSDTSVEVAHVPDDAFKPVDKAQESRLARLQNLWWMLDTADAAEALKVLEEHLLMRRSVVKPPVLSEAQKTEAMKALDRLVDA